MAGMQERLSRHEKEKKASQEEPWKTSKDSESELRYGHFAEARELLERLSWKSYMRSKKKLR